MAVRASGWDARGSALSLGKQGEWGALEASGLRP